MLEGACSRKGLERPALTGQQTFKQEHGGRELGATMWAVGGSKGEEGRGREGKERGPSRLGKG